MRFVRTLVLTALVILSSRIVHVNEIYTLTVNLKGAAATLVNGTYTLKNLPY